jgi:glyoxylase-like metal-dependent hydrolase (beta-lactamase superfamily II)
VFVHRPAKIAFVGDVLFRGSIGRTDFPRGNHDQLLSSIRTRLWPFGDDIQFVPGHGQTSTFGWERKTNPYVADLMFDDEPSEKSR